MIRLTRLNGSIIYLNHSLIERIEIVPNTVITMNSQVQYIVKESIDDINSLVIRAGTGAFEKTDTGVYVS